MDIRIRNYHLDGYGHVNNARYLEFLEEARWRLFEQQNLLQWLDGIQMVVTETRIRYRRSALENDIIRIQTALSGLDKRKVGVRQTVLLESGKTAVEADITLMAVHNGRNVQLPDPLFAALTALMPSKNG
ncbi:acyl-CoA thioesterase [Neisseria sp.]|uniref:acyl-CoA thioesterase n=1 Tax=Neisseria sp. TaxID=192066 RepID=UPI00359F4C49